MSADTPSTVNEDRLDFHVCLSIGAHVYVQQERTVRARASKSNASANDTGASRSFLRSYVDLAAVSVSLPIHSSSLSLFLLPCYPPHSRSIIPVLRLCPHFWLLPFSLALYRALLLSLPLGELCSFQRATLFFSLSNSIIFFHTSPPPSPSFLSFIPLVFSLPSSSTFLVSLLALLFFLLHLPQLLTYIFVTHFHYRSPPVPILNFSYHRSFPPSNALIPHFVGIPCSLCVSCRPPTVLFLFLSSSLSV